MRVEGGKGAAALGAPKGMPIDDMLEKTPRQQHGKIKLRAVRIWQREKNNRYQYLTVPCTAFYNRGTRGAFTGKE
jgi:hypothetical protein